MWLTCATRKRNQSSSATLVSLHSVNRTRSTALFTSTSSSRSRRLLSRLCSAKACSRTSLMNKPHFLDNCAKPLLRRRNLKRRRNGKLTEATTSKRTVLWMQCSANDKKRTFEKNKNQPLCLSLSDGCRVCSTG